MGCRLGLAWERVGPHPRVSIGSGEAPHTTTLHVSTGVSQGLLIAPIRPVYPADCQSCSCGRIGGRGGGHLARWNHREPARAQRAGDAAKAQRWMRYERRDTDSYQLNGEAVDVQTTITVNFRMGGLKQRITLVLPDGPPPRRAVTS